VQPLEIPCAATVYVGSPHRRRIPASATLDKRLRATADQFRAKSYADFISKLATLEEEGDESDFWLEMLRRDFLQLRIANDEFRMPVRGAKPELRQSPIDIRTLQELDRLEDEADQLVAITIAFKKTARGDHGPKPEQRNATEIHP
jgi:hypothetical protein